MTVERSKRRFLIPLVFITKIYLVIFLCYVLSYSAYWLTDLRV